jgi:hypothetical protein
VAELKFAVTVKLYVPAGVPFGLVLDFDDPPPQEESSKRDERIAPTDRFLQLLFLQDAGSRTIPKRTNPQAQYP